MMRRRLFLFTALLAVAFASMTRADTINLATGLDSSGNLITSGGVNVANWTVEPDPTYSPTGIPQTVFPNNADWYGGWIGNGPDSDWIARNANVTNNGPAPYSFFFTFTLTASELSSAAMSGSFAIDDQGTLNLNGNQIGSVPDGAWGSLTAFSVPTGSSDFVVGVNTLSLTITEDDEFLEGVRLQGSLVFNSSVPEPSTIVMCGTALLVGAGLIRRRRRAASPISCA
jgi:hypothetical protein